MLSSECVCSCGRKQILGKIIGCWSRPRQVKIHSCGLDWPNLFSGKCQTWPLGTTVVLFLRAPQLSVKNIDYWIQIVLLIFFFLIQCSGSPHTYASKHHHYWNLFFPLGDVGDTALGEAIQYYTLQDHKECARLLRAGVNLGCLVAFTVKVTTTDPNL